LIRVNRLGVRPQCLFDIRRLYHRLLAHRGQAGHFARQLK
jgi:hypothetical protein